MHMKLFNLASLLLGLTILVESNLALHRLNTAVCRSHCLQEHGPNPPSDEICRNDPPCNMCWEVCEMLHLNFTLWGPMCGHVGICYPGCQTSCGYYNNLRIGDNDVVVEGDAGGVWSFRHPMRLERDSKKPSYTLRWSKPSRLSRQADEPLVYDMLVRNSPTERWREILQTSNTYAEFDEESYTKGQFFKILVITHHGQVAFQEGSPLVDSVDSMQMDESAIRRKPKKPKFPKQLPEPKMETAREWSPVLASLEHHQSGVRADLSWPSAHQDPCKYEVTWKVQENAFEVIGKIYTDRNTANLTLWADYAHYVQIRCFGIDGEIARVSQQLYIPAAMFHTLYQKQSCWRGLYLVPLAGVGGLSIILSVLLLILGIKACSRRRPQNDDQESTSSEETLEGDCATRVTNKKVALALRKSQ